MPRPADPELRAALLEQCFVAAQQGGSLEFSLADLAGRTGISARMLIYHFGSRDLLQLALAARLEAEMRARFATFEADASGVGPAAAVLALWDYVSAPEMRGFLRLMMDVVHRAEQGDPEAAAAGMREVDQWMEFLSSRVSDPAVATGLILIFLGAAVDLLISDDAGRGRRAIEVFLRAVVDAPVSRTA